MRSRLFTLALSGALALGTAGAAVAQDAPPPPPAEGQQGPPPGPRRAVSGRWILTSSSGT